MRALDITAKVLLVIGGLNWGMIGVADFNLIMWIFITVPKVAHLFYIAFGLSALWLIGRRIARS